MTEMIVVDDGGIGEEARSLFVWICEHGPGDEGIVALDGIPLMAAQYRIAATLKPRLARLARATGKSMKLVRYDAVQVLEELRP